MNIIDKIKDLNNNEKNIVLNFCKNKNIIHSKNNNGYFFNIKSNDPLLIELENLIRNIYKNRNIVAEYLNKRKEEQESLKNQIDNDLKKKELEEYNNLIKKLTIQIDNVSLCIKDKLHVNSNFSENEWNNYMNKIDSNLKKKFVYSKNSVYDKLNKIIKNQMKKEINEVEVENNEENYSDKDIDEVIEEDLEEITSDILSDKEDKDEEDFELEKTEIDAEYNETEEQEQINTEIQDEVEETEEDLKQDREYQNDLIKKIKEKLITKGHVFNLNLDCKLVLEEYLK